MLKFTKGHGLGNDFLVMEGVGGANSFSEAQVRAICDRRRGVGADGILVRESGREGLPFMRIYNADGSQPEMCGNGLRVFGLYLVERLGMGPLSLEIDTPAGIRVVDVYEDAEHGVGRVKVDMGFPSQVRSDLSVLCEREDTGGQVRGTSLSMGNPHFVITGQGGSVSSSEAGVLGPAIEANSEFSEGTNVEFVEVLGRDTMRVVVWERGCGLTEACGTGACAAVVVAAREGLVDSGREIAVELPGGVLNIEVEAENERVWMTGPAILVADVAVHAHLLGDSS